MTTPSATILLLAVAGSIAIAVTLVWLRNLSRGWQQVIFLLIIVAVLLYLMGPL